MLKFAAVWQPTQLMELLWQLEQRYPVADWRIRGLHVWPLVRIQIASLVRSGGTAGGNAGSLWQRAVNSFSSQQRAALRDREHIARLTPADLVFLSSSACRSLVDGQWLDRLCDPLREKLELRGYRCLQLEIAAQCECRVPRWRDSYLIQRDVLWRRLLNSLPLQRCQAADCELDGLEDLQQDLARHQLSAEKLSWQQLGRQSALIVSLAAYFKKILSRTRPRQVLAVCYYNKEGLSLNLAARQLGLVSVDLQHGVQGTLHFAYGPWTAVPAAGYELLPDRFWCWSEQDAAAINSWSGKTTPRHTAFCGGNTWAQYWSTSTTAGAQKVREQFRAGKARLGGTRHVLITLQPVHGASQGLEAFGACINHAPADWRWWIRLHPAMAPNEAALRSWRLTLPAERIEWDLASELPLPVLLGGMDAHLTRSSSVVQEAAACAVPSVVTDELGIRYYHEEAAGGMVRLAQSGPDIVSALQQMFAQEKRSGGPSQVLSWDTSIARLCAATGLGAAG